MRISSSKLFVRLSILALLASGAAACSAPPRPLAASVLSFRPTVPGATLWLATSVAVEVVTERDARELESLDPMYVGEIGVRGRHIRASEIALMAAEKGATHFRMVCAGEDQRLDVVLFRVEPERWSALPASLRPAAPAGPVATVDRRAAL